MQIRSRCTEIFGGTDNDPSSVYYLARTLKALSVVGLIALWVQNLLQLISNPRFLLRLELLDVNVFLRDSW